MGRLRGRGGRWGRGVGAEKGGDDSFVSVFAMFPNTSMDGLVLARERLFRLDILVLAWRVP